ncbi:hypothetical protein C2E23DRAFT_573745 [Lenzites betulinus]|nr:hypothetical protein C2E23DRAFT_573745 [Lenzites betulinus]
MGILIAPGSQRRLGARDYRLSIDPLDRFQPLLPCSPAPLLPCSPAPLLPCSPAPLLPCSPAPCSPAPLFPAPLLPWRSRSLLIANRPPKLHHRHMSLDDSEQCLRCQQPSLAPYIPSNPQVKKPEYTPGDIYGIFETIATAVAYFFEEENPKRGRKRPNTIKRPSLIFHRSAPPNRDKTTQFIVVCLFATFHVTQRFEDLPTVLKHFCVPVSPNVLIKPGIEHMHTDPEWAREDAYLLLLPFPARRHRLDVRWEDGRHGDVVGASFRLNEEEYRKIVALTDATFKKWEEWMKENPERAAEAVAEYWVSTSGPSACDLPMHRSLYHQATGERAKETQRNLNSWQVRSKPSPMSTEYPSLS